MKFHNGDPFTAEDVVFSFKRTKGVQLHEKVKEVVIVDPHKVRFVLHEPWPDFMTIYASLASTAAWIVPKDYFEKVGADGFKKHPIGPGPYKFVSNKPGIELVMEAYEGYWRKMPSVKRLVFQSVPEATTRLAMLKRGEVDVAYLLDESLGQTVKNDPTLKLAFSGGVGTFFLDFFDMWDPKSPWADQRVRKAASLAIDRKALSQAATLGASKPNGNIVVQGFRICAADRTRPVRSGAGQEAARRGGLSERVRCRRSSRLAALCRHRRGDHRLSRRRRHQDKDAHVPSGPRFSPRSPQKAHRVVHVRARRSMAMHRPAWRRSSRPAAPMPMAGSPISTSCTSASSPKPIARKREAMLHQIQRMLHERTRFAPIFDYVWPSGVGPRVEEPGADADQPVSWAAPLEDVRLKRP